MSLTKKLRDLDLSRSDEETFRRLLSELMQKEEYLSMNGYVQHGDTSCLTHSIAVAYYSFAFIKKFGIKCDEKSLIRGALLHDYFLYDWHVAAENNNWHGFTHPKKALRNAEIDYTINQIEADIIKKHMFPLTPSLPGYRESAVVCFIDKLCSIFEIFRAKPYVLVRHRFLPALTHT